MVGIHPDVTAIGIATTLRPPQPQEGHGHHALKTPSPLALEAPSELPYRCRLKLAPQHHSNLRHRPTQHHAPIKARKNNEDAYLCCNPLSLARHRQICLFYRHPSEFRGLPRWTSVVCEKPRPSPENPAVAERVGRTPSQSESRVTKSARGATRHIPIMSPCSFCAMLRWPFSCCSSPLAALLRSPSLPLSASFWSTLIASWCALICSDT